MLAERTHLKIITSHKGTDFDGLASVVAGTVLYPDAVPVLSKTINPNVKNFLALHKELFQIKSPQEIDFNLVQQLIIVDTNSWSRLDHIEPLRNRTDLDIFVWDHHPGDCEIAATWKCVRETGATITLMTEQIREQGKKLTPVQATLFLAGIYEDTGGLFFPSTTAADAYAAGYLLEQNADLIVLNSFLKPAYNAEQKNILFEMLKSAERIKINQHTISCNILEVEGHVGNLSIVVNMYREIVNVNAAFGIFFEKNRKVCIVIGRSNTDELNMGSILRGLGGGGHPGAGSAMIKSLEPGEVRAMLIEQIRKDHQPSSLQELMTYPIVSVSSDTSMKKVAMILREKGFSGLPVVDDKKLVGIISRRDFRKLKRENQIDSPVKAFMSRDQIITIASGKSPAEAANLIVKHDIGRIPVIENEEIIGIITRTDVMRYFYNLVPDKGL